MEQVTISNHAVYFLLVTFLFYVGSMAGWILELLFRRFLSSNNPDRKWINPGFLMGPYLPIYGFGLLALFLMSLFPYVGISSLKVLTWQKTVICILAMGAIMTVIEYIAGLVFIKGLHVKLWDYSGRWGNVQGIICPLFSVIWTILAALYYFFLQPRIIRLVTWYFNNIAYTFVVGMFFGIFFVDLFYSVHVVNIIRRFAAEHEIIVRYEELKASIRNAADEAREKAHFVFAFKSERPLREHLEAYGNRLSRNMAQVRQDLQDEMENVRQKITKKRS